MIIKQPLLIATLLAIAAWSKAQNIEFDQHCEGCHSPETVDLAEFDFNRDDLVAFISDEMPADEPSACVDSCAETIGDFLLANFTPINKPPTAVIDGKFNLVAPETNNLNASGSHDDEGIVSYLWTMPDGSTLNGSSFIANWPEVGDFPLSLTVTDAEGLSDTDEVMIRVRPAAHNDGPTADTSMSTNTQGLFPLTVNLDASASQPGSTTIVSYEWDFGAFSLFGRTASYTLEAVGVPTVLLIVTDANGL